MWQDKLTTAYSCNSSQYLIHQARATQKGDSRKTCYMLLCQGRRLHTSCQQAWECKNLDISVCDNLSCHKLWFARSVCLGKVQENDDLDLPLFLNRNGICHTGTLVELIWMHRESHTQGISEAV